MPYLHTILAVDLFFNNRTLQITSLYKKNHELVFFTKKLVI